MLNSGTSVTFDSADLCLYLKKSHINTQDLLFKLKEITVQLLYCSLKREVTAGKFPATREKEEWHNVLPECRDTQEVSCRADWNCWLEQWVHAHPLVLRHTCSRTDLTDHSLVSANAGALKN